MFEDFLLTGADPVAKRFKDATAKSIVIINLARLAGLLKGQLTFDRLSTLAALDSDDFVGDRFQPASNSTNVVFDDSKTSPIADAEEQDLDKKPAAVKEVASNPMPGDSDEIPPLQFEDEEDAKPAAAGANHENMAHANPNENTSTALTTVSGQKTKFQMPRPGKNCAIADVFDDQRFVLTGLFPEVGGGSGLNLGKDKMKNLIETFGGRFLVLGFTSSVLCTLCSLILLCWFLLMYSIAQAKSLLQYPARQIFLSLVRIQVNPRFQKLLPSLSH